MYKRQGVKRGGVEFPRHQSHVARTHMHWHTPNAHCRLRVCQHNAYNLVRGKRNFTHFQRRNDRTRQRRLDYVAISLGFSDICAQTRKLS